MAHGAPLHGEIAGMAAGTLVVSGWKRVFSTKMPIFVQFFRQPAQKG
jgi:hypothetical protein